MSFSFDTSSAVPAAPAAAAGGARRARRGLTERLRAVALRAPRPELGALIALAAVLNLWALARNGWANDYYSAAVRSMSASWHNFLYASADPSGVMTVDKPPLALWVQSLSVRLFGYHPLSMLVPQALMGVASVVLCYDLVRRRFGRAGGFVAGLALALTPITVAISRHNNPDALLVLCCVAALWCAVRALEDGRVRWPVLAGVCVGLGFETKMAVALVVVPGIVAAWLLVAPRGRPRALRELLTGGAAMVLVGGAWPALIALTPASQRPWISGTSDNSILSLISGYNGLGRVDGQAGGPGGSPPGGAGGGSVFGESPGVGRLLNAALGGQAGWTLGFAAAAAFGLLIATRLRRSDPRTGWLLAVGGAFLTTAVLFSAASGIFHPYYVSLLAPFAAALVGAGAAQLLGRRGHARVFAPLALAAGVATTLAVLGNYPGQLPWLPPVLIAVCAAAALVLALPSAPRLRRIAGAAAIASLLLAPSAWALDTLGHATSGTFPAGGPANLATGPGGGMPARTGSRFGSPAVGARAGSRTPASPLFGSAGAASAPPRPPVGPGAAGVPGGSSEGAPPSGVPGAPSGAVSGGFFGGGSRGGGPGAGGAGAPLGDERTILQAVAYVRRHGGGTIAVSSQSSAAQAIIGGGAKVAGIGGFSGRESDVSISWLAGEVRSGAIRWFLAEQAGASGFDRLPGDTRAGSRTAISAVSQICRRVTLAGAESSSAPATSGSGGSSGTAGAGALYDCQGRASALQRLGG